MSNCFRGVVNVTDTEGGPTATGMIPEGGTAEKKLPSPPPHRLINGTVLTGTDNMTQFFYIPSMAMQTVGTGCKIKRLLQTSTTSRASYGKIAETCKRSAPSSFSGRGGGSEGRFSPVFYSEKV